MIASFGVLAFAIGLSITSQNTEDWPRFFGYGTVGFGLYLIVLGAVSQGIQLARPTTAEPLPDISSA